MLRKQIPNDGWDGIGCGDSSLGLKDKKDQTYSYSSVPNRRAVRNKRVCRWENSEKTLNVQDRIDVQGEFFSAKSIIVQGGIEKTQYVIEDLLLQ